MRKVYTNVIYKIILFLNIFLVISSPTYSSQATELSSLTSKNYYWLPQSPRVIASTAIVNIGLFAGDGMLPLLGNTEHFLFGDLIGGYGTNDTSLASPGLGFRTIKNNYIVGAYLFGDYDRTHFNGNFGVISPGVELLGLKWDAHLNGYFPTQRAQQINSAVFADSLGVGEVHFEAGTHNQYNVLLTPYAVIGNGMDAEVGYSFSMKNNLRSRVYLGGYYYQPPNNYQVNTIEGISTGFTHSVNKTVSFSLFNSYDQVNHYKIGVGINLVFGGEVNILSQDIHDRLLDPVQRHIGIIATGAGTYDQEGIKYAGTGLEYNNIYFLASNGTGDGTYGSPAPLNQDTLDFINSSSPNNAQIYLQGGNAALYNVAQLGGLEPYTGQNFYGRTADYTAAAVDSSRPTLFLENNENNYAIFNLQYDNTISDLQFNTTYTDNSSASAIVISGPQTTNTTISNSSFFSFPTSIYIPVNPANLTITGSTFTNNAQAINYTAGAGSLNIQDSTITAESTFNFGGFSPSGINFENDGTDTIVFTANQLQINLNRNNSAQGLSFFNTSSGVLNATINNLTITGAGAAGADGLDIYNNNTNGQGGQINVHMENSLLENNGADSGNGNIYLQADNGGVITFDFINSQSNQGHTYGLLVVNGDPNHNLNDTVNVTIENSIFDGSGYGNVPPYPFGNIGLWSLGSGTINFSATNSTISNSTNGAPGLWISNGVTSGTISNSTINVNNLSGTTFLNNAAGGIYAYELAGTNTSTNINYTDAIFNTSSPNIANDPASTSTINWIPAPP